MSTLTDNGYEAPARPEGPVRDNGAWRLYLHHLETMVRAQAVKRAEPTVEMEYTDAAKGEVRAITKVYAPMGCDLAALTSFAQTVAHITSAAHAAANLRTSPIDQQAADTLNRAADARDARRPRSVKPA